MTERDEIKKLLRNRDELLDGHRKLDDSSNEDNSDIINNIYKNGRNTISEIIYSIDVELLKYCKQSMIGEWLLKIKGITPDIAAGLLVYFDIKNKDCAAQFIKYSGADNCNIPHNTNVRNLMNKISDNFKSEPESLYYKLYNDKFIELLSKDLPIVTARIRADRYMRKVFISHLFEEMYREEYDGKLPERYNDSNCIIIEPEVQYTK